MDFGKITSFFSLSALLLGGSQGRAATFAVQFSHPATISVPSGTGLKPLQTTKSDEIARLETKNIYWIEAPGKVPVVIVPAAGSEEALPLQMADVVDLKSGTSQEIIESSIQKIAQAYAEADQKIAQKNLTEAENILRELDQRYPYVDTTELKLASVGVLRGDLKGAILRLKKIVAKNPGYRAAQELLAVLNKETGDTKP